MNIEQVKEITSVKVTYKFSHMLNKVGNQPVSQIIHFNQQLKMYCRMMIPIHHSHILGLRSGRKRGIERKRGCCVSVSINGK